MKRVCWVARVAVIVAASYCIFTPGGSDMLRGAQARGCNTSQACSRNSDNNCYCPDVTIGGPGCTGCYVPNNSPGCGSCRSAEGGNGEEEFLVLMP
jgi:hypothetical protein